MENEMTENLIIVIGGLIALLSVLIIAEILAEKLGWE
jgi:hypothetical protein